MCQCADLSSVVSIRFFFVAGRLQTDLSGFGPALDKSIFRSCGPAAEASE